MNMVLLGPPGAGKGTLAGLLMGSYDLLHISTGDLIREEINSDSAIGLDAKNYMDKGELVPDKLVTRLLANKVRSLNESKGFMLDGFPRTKPQAVSLDRILKRIKHPLNYAIYLDASMGVIIDRIIGRRVAPKSGKVYHVRNRPPKTEGICDVSGEKLVVRADDNEATVRKRMEVYLENTLPIIEYYESQGILVKVDGDKDSEEVQLELKDLFDGQTNCN